MRARERERNTTDFSTVQIEHEMGSVETANGATEGDLKCYS